MPSTKSIVLALALTAPAAALVPPATQRVPATIRHADDAARAARREALMQASERAAARIEATRNSGQSTPMRPDDMMAFVKPATEAQAPDEMSYVPTDDDGRANYAVGGGERHGPVVHEGTIQWGTGGPAHTTRAGLLRGPPEIRERHWTKNDDEAAGYDTIKRQFGQRPDEDIEIDMSDTFLVNQLKVGGRARSARVGGLLRKSVAEAATRSRRRRAKAAPSPPRRRAAAAGGGRRRRGRRPRGAAPRRRRPRPRRRPGARRRGAAAARARRARAAARHAGRARPDRPARHRGAASGAALGEDQQVVGALGAMQYAARCSSTAAAAPGAGQVADQIKRARDVMVAEAPDAPAAAAAPPPVAAAPPAPAPAAAPAPAPAAAPAAAAAKTEVHLGNRGSSLEPALATLDAAGVAARVAAIGPGFSQFAAAIEELACDGAFLASLSPAELDETFEDIGVTARLQRRRVMFALGLGK